MVKHLPCKTFRTSFILYNVLFDNFSIVLSDRISFRSKAWVTNSFSVKKGPSDLNATPSKEAFIQQCLALAFKEKLSLFQNMWTPDHASFNFFSCVHNHIKTKSIQCDNFCGGFSSPYCDHLAYFLSTNNWPPEAWKRTFISKGFPPHSYLRGFSPSLQ